MTVGAVYIGKDKNNSDQGWDNIFAKNSVEKKDRVGTGELIDLWLYPACTPHCGKDGNGKWQAMQEVTKAGAGTDAKSFTERTPCKANGGQAGPTNPGPVNANKEGYTPPGWKEDKGGDEKGGGGTP